MLISEMIERLQEIQEQYGDLEIVGGTLVDDESPHLISVINHEGLEYTEYGGEVQGVFIE